MTDGVAGKEDNIFINVDGDRGDEDDAYKDWLLGVNTVRTPPPELSVEDIGLRPARYRVCTDTTTSIAAEGGNTEDEYSISYDNSATAAAKQSTQRGEPLHYAPINFIYSIEVLKNNLLDNNSSFSLVDAARDLIVWAVFDAVLDSLHDSTCPAVENNRDEDNNGRRLAVRTFSNWAFNEWRDDCTSTTNATKCDEFSGSVLVGFDARGANSDFRSVGETVLAQIEADMDQGAYLDRINLQLDAFDLSAVRMQYLKSNYFNNMADNGVLTPFEGNASEQIYFTEAASSDAPITPFGKVAIPIISFLSFFLCSACVYACIALARRLIYKPPIVVNEGGSVSSASLNPQQNKDRTFLKSEVADLESLASTTDVHECNCMNFQDCHNQDCLSPSIQNMAIMYKDDTELQLQQSRSVEPTLESYSVFSPSPPAPTTRRGFSSAPILAPKKSRFVVSTAEEDDEGFRDEPDESCFVKLPPEAQNCPSILPNHGRYGVMSPTLTANMDCELIPTSPVGFSSYLFSTDTSKHPGGNTPAEKFENDSSDPGNLLGDSRIKILGAVQSQDEKDGSSPVIKSVSAFSSSSGFDDTAMKIDSENTGTVHDYQKKGTFTDRMSNISIFRLPSMKSSNRSRPSEAVHSQSNVPTHGKNRSGLYSFYAPPSEASLPDPRFNQSRSSLSKSDEGGVSDSDQHPSNRRTFERNISDGIGSRTSTPLVSNYAMRRHRSLADDEISVPLEIGTKRLRTDGQGKLRQEIAL